jgi:hypothetical protein
MILLIVVLLCVLLVGYFHYTQGFFSAAISAILSILCAVFALSFDETLLEHLLGGKAGNYAHGMMLLLLFAGSYSILRILFDKFVPGQMRLPLLVDRIGAAVMGLVAGVFAMGIITIAAQEFPFGPTFMGYSRYSVDDDHDENMQMPGRQQSKTYHVYDELKSDEPGVFDDSMKHTLYVDDLVVNTTAYLSNGGSLAGDQALTRIHPDFLTELFGQRLGIEPGARNVAMNNASKGVQDVTVAGLFSLPSVFQAESEVPKTRAIFTAKLGQALKPKPDEILLVVRTVFAHSAVDSDSLIRVSTGAVHLVAPVAKDDGTVAYTDYYPLGTLEGDSTLFLNKLDDPLFLDAHGGAQAADFVFIVKKGGFIDTAKMKVLPGAFLDVKRMARVDLSDQLVKSEFTTSPTVAVLRKTLALPDGGLVTIPSLVPPPTVAVVTPAPAAPAPAPPSPTPAPPTPTPTPAPTARDTGLHSPQAAADNGVFDVIGATASSSLSIPISCGADETAKQITLPGGDAILKNGKFLSLNLDVQETQATLSNGPRPVKDLLAKDGEGLIIVSGTAGHGGWDWAAKADQINLVDSAGKTYQPNGVWADVDQAGQKKFFARYSENYPLDALTPGTGKVGNVWFCFSIPAGTEVKQIALGAQQIGEFPAVTAQGQ